MPVETVELRGCSIRYRHRPGVPLLLYASGFGAGLETTAPLADAAAARGLGFAAMDLPGVGGSGRPRRPLRLPGYADLLAALLDRLAVDRAVAVGHSWGGVLAQELAHRHPRRTSHLVLACTSAGTLMLPGTPRALLGFLRPGLYRSRRPPDAGDAPPGAGRSPAAGVPAIDLIGGGRQLLAAAGWTSLPWLHRLTMPALVLAAGRDPLVPRLNLRVLAARLPQAEMSVLEGVGHLFPYTHPELLVDTVDKWLRCKEQGARDKEL